MRDDLKERLRKAGKRLQAYDLGDGASWYDALDNLACAWANGGMDEYFDIPHSWMFTKNGAYRSMNDTPWPDSRVEAFLNWAEQTEAKP